MTDRSAGDSSVPEAAGLSRGMSAADPAGVPGLMPTSDPAGGSRVMPAPAADAPRLTVRHRLPDGSATDVVATLVASDDTALTLLPDDGGPVVVARRDVVVTREVPARRVRPSSSPADLERLAARGWPGTEQARLGGWLLRAGGGWTGRANSALVTGDPGVPLDDALEEVAAFYRQRGLPPRLHLPRMLDAPGAPGGASRAEGGDPIEAVDAASEAAGWVAYDETLVLTADLRRLDLESSPEHPSGPVVSSWAASPEEAWLGVLRGGSSRTDPAAAQVLGGVPAHYLSLTSGDTVVAVGRVVVTDDWCGIAAIEVEPASRRRGLGRRVATELLGRGREHGARFAYLQTLRDNTPALTLYAELGFVPHHAYHYRRLDER